MARTLGWRSAARSARAIVSLPANRPPTYGRGSGRSRLSPVTMLPMSSTTPMAVSRAPPVRRRQPPAHQWPGQHGRGTIWPAEPGRQFILVAEAIDQPSGPRLFSHQWRAVDGRPNRIGVQAACIRHLSNELLHDRVEDGVDHLTVVLGEALTQEGVGGGLVFGNALELR